MSTVQYRGHWPRIDKVLIFIKNILKLSSSVTLVMVQVLSSHSWPRTTEGWTVLPVCSALPDSAGLQFHSREESFAITYRSYSLETESQEDKIKRKTCI